MLVIFHLNKGISTDPLLRHEGSAAFTQIVRGGLMLGHDPDDPDGEDGNQRVLAVSSSNLAAVAPALVYRIETAQVAGAEGEEISTARVLCVGESATGAHDLLRGQPDEEEQTGTDEAEAFLTEELGSGPRPANEVTKQARQLGISEKQLRLARGRLGVQSKRVGGVGSEGHWEWSLPPSAEFTTKAPPLRRPPDVREEGRLRRLSHQQRDCDPSAVPKAPPGAEGRLSDQTVSPVRAGQAYTSSQIPGARLRVERVLGEHVEVRVEGLNDANQGRRFSIAVERFDEDLRRVA